MRFGLESPVLTEGDLPRYFELMRATNIIVLGSLNKGKIVEYRSLFAAHPELQFKPVADLIFNPGALKGAETGNTYYENALSKCKLSHFGSHYPTIGDDTGIEVDALEGRPGVFSDRYATSRKEGQTQDQANVRKMLEELKGVPLEKRTARFTCTLVFMVEGVVLSTVGTMEGSILEAPRGSNGFGYDPIFLVKGTDKSLAEMTLEEKNKVSHRAKAFEEMLKVIKDKGVKLVRP